MYLKKTNGFCIIWHEDQVSLAATTGEQPQVASIHQHKSIASPCFLSQRCKNQCFSSIKIHCSVCKSWKNRVARKTRNSKRRKKTAKRKDCATSVESVWSWVARWSKAQPNTTGSGLLVSKETDYWQKCSNAISPLGVMVLPSLWSQSTDL